MLCLRLFSEVLLNMFFESPSLPHEPPLGLDSTFAFAPLANGTFEGVVEGELWLQGRVGFWFAGEVLISLF